MALFKWQIESTERYTMLKSILNLPVILLVKIGILETG